MRDNTVTPDELNSIVSTIPGLESSITDFYFSESKEYTDKIKDVKISDSGGYITCELHEYDGSWTKRDFHYWPPKKNGLFIELDINNDFSINNYDHPLYFTVNETPRYKTLKEALEYVNSH